MDVTDKFVVAVVMRDETRIWTTDAARGEEPNTIHPASDSHKHVREAQHHGGHDSSSGDKAYYEAISAALSRASEILLIGHGTGKGNSMLTFVQHLERHHQDVAKKIVGAVDENIVAMTEPEILASARAWIKAHRNFI